MAPLANEWITPQQAECSLEDRFATRWRYHGGPVPVRQFVFHPTRKWPFDFAFPLAKVAVEIQGGTWKYGRHNRGAGYENDCQKNYAAVLLGWQIFYLTGAMVMDESLYPAMIEFVKGRQP